MHRNVLSRPAFYPHCERGHVVRVNDSGNHCPICWVEDNGPDVAPDSVVESEPTVDVIPDTGTHRRPPPVALVPAAEPVAIAEDDETWGLEALPPSPHDTHE